MKHHWIMRLFYCLPLFATGSSGNNIPHPIKFINDAMKSEDRSKITKGSVSTLVGITIPRTCWVSLLFGGIVFAIIAAAALLPANTLSGLQRQPVAKVHSTSTSSDIGKAEGAPSAQVVLVGTLHGGHRINPNYSIDTLEEIIVKLGPAAILCEMPPTIDGKSTIKNGCISKSFARNENLAANLAAKALGVPLIPYDREGRNEFYKATDYFRRQDQAYKLLGEWAEQQAQKDPESVEAQTVTVLLESATRSQAYLVCSAGPDIINSPAYDKIIRNKKCCQHKIIPKLLAAAGREGLAKEYCFFRDAWETRNQIMADNIIKIAQKQAGRHLVVLCGAEHRYILRALLGKATGVTLKEFYEISEPVQLGKMLQSGR